MALNLDELFTCCEDTQAHLLVQPYKIWRGLKEATCFSLNQKGLHAQHIPLGNINCYHLGMLLRIRLLQAILGFLRVCHAL